MAQAGDMDTLSATQDRSDIARRWHLWLGLFLFMSCVASLAVGASGASFWSALGRLVSGQNLTQLEQVVLWDIRLPRTILGLLVGAALAVSGTVLQGLFRNPLADPGIVGITAGASVGAIFAIVFVATLPLIVLNAVGIYLIPLAACIGSWVSVMLLYSISTRRGRTSVATMLLAGIALAALAGAIVGVMVFAADDQQLRDLTFWQLGSLGGATWAKIATAGPIIGAALVGAVMLGSALNAMSLGEATAMHLGIPVQRAKNLAILTVSIATGAAVAVSGGIGFVGIVVPHLLRLATGPDHKPLLINAALLGGALLIWADVVARVVIAPAELPIGVVTAILGAPVFLWILLRRRGVLEL
ncbi:iron ABC transporter permease [uncultured Roseovarius sp.]|uniref:FecCD family ABC transporter permease n=1 Tax=uncultured Roseovarius sp. TaxID=293344 RepID=UPI002629CB44|nr:iron ABC transporter permease [uncultured Roseovarius sp.]